jgi:Carboxypeptidase regulatory-like domain/TonB dependent receptor
MPNLGKLRLISFVLAVVLVLAPRTGWSQNVYGTIAGTVTDPSGAAIGDTAVTLTNLDTGEARNIRTDASGNYTFVNILPGRYRIEAEKAGFKKFAREPITVQIESGLRVDMALEVGAVNQTVEVTGEAPLLQPETSSLGQVVETRSVTELPLNGRNPLALVALTAGVVPQGQPSAGNSSTGNPVGANPFAAGDFQIGGGQAGQSQILIDGVPTNGAYLNVVTLIPTQDAVEEFKVQTNNLGPEYGRFAGGVINLNTKSGTNSFHGSAYEFLRNKVLNANDFFSNAGGSPRPPFTQNQFGANVGGPVFKDKLFFFSSYEGFRQRKGSILTTWVPTALERNGDFSQIGSTGTSTVLPIYDPTTSANCTSGGGACRTAFPGNKIPANRIDPTAQALLNYFPLPNQTGNSFGNFVESYSTGGNVDQIDERIDYNLSEKQRIFGRYSRSHVLSLPDSPFNQVCSDRCTEDTLTHQVALGDTILFSPKTILDLHVGYTRYAYLRTPLSQGIDLSKFGPNWAALAPEMTYTHIPTVCVSQVSGDNRWGNGSWCSAGTGSGIGAHDDTLSFEPMLSKIMGNHNFKFGGEYRMLRNNYYQSNQPAGLFNFNAGMTSANPKTGVPGTDSGNGFASFLLGYGNDGNASEPAKTADQVLYGAVYAGDTFQVTKNLTLNLGVRVDLQGDWTERYNRIVVFNPSETSPIAGQVGIPNLKGGFDLVKSSNHPSRTAFPAWKNVSPRVGLSYQLGRNTVIRTGYGMFYLPVDGRWDDAPHNLFINSITNTWLPAQADGVTPRNPLSNPFPAGIAPPPGRNQSFINVQGNGLEAPLSSNPAPYVQQWNFDIQRQLPGNTLFDIAYAGSKGTHLPMHSQDLNQLPPQYLPTNAAQVSALTTLVPNPFFGVVQSGNVGSNPTIKAAQLLLPFPQYDDVAMAEPDDRDSIYHSMQAKFQKRFAAGAQLLATYTVAKLIDNTTSEINWLEASPVSWNDANAYNLHNERSLDAFDVSQRLVIASVLDLPVGRGKKFLSNLNGVANKLVGGWGIDTIITFQSGFPIIISGCPGALGSSGIPNAAGCARATRTALSHLTSGSLDQKLAHWFDTSVFTSGDPNVYNYGNDSRTEPNIRNDGVKNFDFAIFKNTKFGPDERLGLEFRSEFFNLFNRVQFNPPNTSCCGGSSFGQVTGQYNLPRVVQFALRLTF